MRVNLKIIGLCEETVDKYVEPASAQMWFDMLGKQVQFGEDRLFIRQARMSMNPLTCEVDNVTVTVSKASC